MQELTKHELREQRAAERAWKEMIVKFSAKDAIIEMDAFSETLLDTSTQRDDDDGSDPVGPLLF